jgi:hypothetical protein
MEEWEDGPRHGRPRTTGRRQNRRRAGVDRPQGRGPEGDDHLRPQQGELPVEIRPARARGRAVEPVSGRTALQDVEDSELRAAETEVLDGHIESAARPSHERDPRAVLERAWRFAHENDPRTETAAVNDRVRPGLAERAALARSDLVRKLSPLDPDGPWNAMRARRLPPASFPMRNRVHRSFGALSDPVRSTTRHGP